MEVINPQAAILCNYEVLSLINEMKPASVSVNQEGSQLATIIYETSHYLHELPCSSQTPEKIDNLMKELKLFPIPLTKLEKLMICNNPPETVLQLSLIVKDCEEKMSESDIDSWLRKINEILT